MMIKSLARILAPLLIASGLVLGLQAASEAHDNAVSGVPTCNTSTGQIDITWTVANDYGLTEVLSNATRVQSQLNGVTVAKNGTVTATESVPANGATYSLRVHGRWSDGFAKDSTSPGVRVPSTCQIIQHTTASATFTDQVCDNDVFTVGTFDASSSDLYDTRVTGDPLPGDTVTIVFVPHQNVVIDGQTNFQHTYPTTPNPQTCHKSPPPPCGVCHLPWHKVKDSTHSGTYTCRGVLVGGTYNRILVRPGTNCTLVNVWVNRSVKANGSHDLTMAGTTVRKSVYASHMTGDLTIGATNRTCSADPMIGGSIYAVGSHNVVLCNLQVCHKVVLKHNDGRIMIRDSRGRRLVIQHNDRFVTDGSRHRAPSAIRVYHDRFKHRSLHPNRRQVIVRR